MVTASGCVYLTPARLNLGLHRSPSGPLHQKLDRDGVAPVRRGDANGHGDDRGGRQGVVVNRRRLHGHAHPLCSLQPLRSGGTRWHHHNLFAALAEEHVAATRDRLDDASHLAERIVAFGVSVVMVALADVTDIQERHRAVFRRFVHATTNRSQHRVERSSAADSCQRVRLNLQCEPSRQAQVGRAPRAGRGRVSTREPVASWLCNACHGVSGPMFLAAPCCATKATPPPGRSHVDLPTVDTVVSRRARPSLPTPLPDRVGLGPRCVVRYRLDATAQGRPFDRPHVSPAELQDVRTLALGKAHASCRSSRR